MIGIQSDKMSTNKSPKLRKAGEPVYSTQRSALKLLKPDSECSTLDLIIKFPDEVKEMLSGMKRKRTVDMDDDTPDAA